MYCVLLFANPAGWDSATRYSCPNQRCWLGIDGTAWLPTANRRQYCVHINTTWRLTQAPIHFSCLSHFICLIRSLHGTVHIVGKGKLGLVVSEQVLSSHSYFSTPSTPDSLHLQYQVFNSFLHIVLYVYCITLRARRWFMHSHPVCMYVLAAYVEARGWFVLLLFYATALYGMPASNAYTCTSVCTASNWWGWLQDHCPFYSYLYSYYSMYACIHHPSEAALSCMQHIDF